MKPSEIINIINKIENKFPVEKWVINKIHIWPLIRIELYFKFRNLARGRRKNNFRMIRDIYGLIHIFIGFFKYIYVYLSDFRHNDSIDNAVDIVFLTYSSNRTLLKGFYYDRFCDPLVDIFQNMGMKTLTFEVGLPNYEYRIPRYRLSIFIQYRLDYSRIKNRLFNKRLNMESEELDAFSDFIKFLESENYSIVMPNIQNLRYRVNIVLEMAEYFKKIFNKIKPSVAFVADYYSSLDRFAFNLACRQTGVPSVDIQHGFTGRYHTSYGQWSKIPEGGYELLPSAFWCWCEEEANTILEWNKNVSNVHRPFVGGNIWLNLWKNQNSDLVKYYDHQILQIKSHNNKPVYILYTFDQYYSIPEWIPDVIRLSSESLHWWIRIHPCQLDKREVIRNFLKKRKITNFEIDIATDFPLPALLRHTNVHVTATSSTIKEAEYFGIPSIFTHKDAVEFHPEQIASGWAVSAYNKEELLKALEFQLSKRNKIKQPCEKPPTDNLSIIKEFLGVIKNEKR